MITRHSFSDFLRAQRRALGSHLTDRCELCHVGDRYQFVQRYGVAVCRMCLVVNWDGWNPRYEETLLNRVKEKGLPVPERNRKGLLPRD